MPPQLSRAPGARQGGERELVLGVDDELLKETPRSIPRADVAELCVQALLQPEARNRCAPAADCFAWTTACGELVAAGRLQTFVHACW